LQIIIGRWYGVGGIFALFLGVHNGRKGCLEILWILSRARWLALFAITTQAHSMIGVRCIVDMRYLLGGTFIIALQNRETLAFIEA